MSAPPHTIDEETDASLAAVAARYAVAITPAMDALIAPDDPADPIAAQFRPHLDELAVAPDERADPIDDAGWSPVPGVVRRYRDRVLLAPTQACAVYCRFCFRREAVGPGAAAAVDLDEALDFIRAEPEVWEVILTGGDPLILSPRRIAALTEALDAIAHVKVARWHTRVPVVDPERITPALVEALRAPGLATWIAVHANHPREFTDAARTALARLADGGIAMVSQSVLLKGVNDDPAVLEALMRAFVEARVKPYYLHHLDRAPGTKRFRTTIAEGRALADGLRRAASGLCQPTYVLDVPDGAFKAPLAAACAEPDGPDWRVRDASGAWRPYRDGD